MFSADELPKFLQLALSEAEFIALAPNVGQVAPNARVKRPL
jgi:hypothetical protein